MVSSLVLTATALSLWLAGGGGEGATVVKEWRFDTEGDTQAWVARHDLADFTVADGALRMTIAGGDPYFHAPPYEFDGLRAHLIEVQALLPEAAEWQRMQLFFGTPEAPQHSPQRELSSVKTASEGEVVFRFDLHEHEQAKGRVGNIRLDIDGAAVGSLARIRAIRILRAPARVQTDMSVGVELVRSGSPIEVKLRAANAGGGDAPAVECSLDTGNTMERTDAPGTATVAIPSLAPCDTHEATLTYRVLAQNGPAHVRLVPPEDSGVPPAEVTVMAVEAVEPRDGPPRQEGRVFRGDDGRIYVDGAVRVAVERLPDGRYGPVRVFAPDGAMLGACACLARQCSLTPVRSTAPFFPAQADIAPDGRAVSFSGGMHAPGVSADITYGLTRDGTIRITHRLHTKRSVALYRFDGPMLRLGEACFGTETQRAIFPGLEYLGPGEHSSSIEDIDPPGNVRFSPEPTKVTMPIMIHQGPGLAIGLSWDNLANWAPGEAFPTPVFSSPNAVEGQQNHLMGIFAPSVPRYVLPNTTVAHQPFELKAGRTIQLSAELWAGDSPEAVLAEYVAKRWNGAIPKLVRSRRAELELCRFAYTHSCYDAKAKGWVHAHGGQWGYAPHAFNILALLMDAEREPDQQQAQALRTLAMEVWDAARAAGQYAEPPLLLALFAGDVEHAVQACRSAGEAAARSQLPTGGWRFVPDESHRPLARWGDESLGVTGSRIPSLLHAALVTADPDLVDAFMRAVTYCDRFTVPRGAQTWELAVHTPDIMASADGLEIYLAAYQLTGEKHYLEQARHWAVTGLPFVFFWRHGQIDALHFATIPVFGATHYRGSWFGRPVQWCGLDYAKSLIRLSRFQHELPGEEDIPWRRIAEGILRSAMIQQYAEGQWRGCYPDVWLLPEDSGAGPAINPQLILTDLWMLEDYDPDVRTVVVPVAGRRVHVSALAHVSAKQRGDSIDIQSNRSAGAIVSFIVANIDAPKQVRSTSELPEVQDPGEQRGYRYHPDTRLLTATVVAGGDGVARLEVDL